MQQLIQAYRDAVDDASDSVLDAIMQKLHLPSDEFADAAVDLMCEATHAMLDEAPFLRHNAVLHDIKLHCARKVSQRPRLAALRDL